MTPAALVERLQGLLGPDGLLTDAAAGLVYARDASHLGLGRPLAVALPATPAELQQVVALCAAAGVPLVPRGTGTGLSGGAVPSAGSLVLGTSRLNALGVVNGIRGRVRAEAGVLNEHVSTVAEPSGFHFAPDPSSQSAASIGGNIATNAGGPHCLRHGVMLQHVADLEWFDSAGVRRVTSRGVAGERGLDLTSLLCGSEGTLGVISAADLNLVPNPSDVVTLLAFFPLLADATDAAVALLGQGLLPVAVEMVDQPMLKAVEQAFGFGFPTDVQAAMITEFNGSPAAVAEDGQRAMDLLRRAGARDVRRAVDAAERANLWRCRKQAFGAVGRLAPNYVTMDVVVPLGDLPDLVREIQAIKTRQGVKIATAFHAGDGNLHPGIHYDDRDPEAQRRAHAAADEIIAAAQARNGTATGEHGIGIRKRHVLPRQMDAVTARLHHDIKRAFDPDSLFNPGKLLPDPAAQYADLKPVPTGADFQWRSLTVTAPGTMRLSALQCEALTHGLWLPVGLPGNGNVPGLGHDPTVTQLLDHLAVGPTLLGTGSTRDFLLESWAETGAGEVFHSGAPVFKNVAGYDLHHMLCGSGGFYVRHLAATFQLRPRPEQVLVLHLTSVGGEAGDLAPLWVWLAGRSGRLAAPQAVVDPRTGVHVLVAGRDRPWDLGRVPTELEALMQPRGWSVAVVSAMTFGETNNLLAQDVLPDWSVAAGDWTSLSPWPNADRTPGAPGPARFVRQGRPDRLWVPEARETAEDWFADPLIVAGAVSEPPPPCADVPLRLLRRLKRVFDPQYVLPTPPWLREPAVADE